MSKILSLRLVSRLAIATVMVAMLAWNEPLPAEQCEPFSVCMNACTIAYNFCVRHNLPNCSAEYDLCIEDCNLGCVGS
jgi:hypothetical protein